MATPIRILILGASYGLLPGIKLSLAGHHVTLVGRADELAAMKRDGLTLSLPIRRNGSECRLHAAIAQKPSTGIVALSVPANIDISAHDFVILAMQEPQFASQDVSSLMLRIAAARLPCLSVMNLPPPPFLKTIETIPAVAFEGVFSSHAVWKAFASDRFSVACPDAQAIRPDPDRPGHLRVTLASNFKAAPFSDCYAQSLLERLAHDMSRLKSGGLRPPVHLLARGSRYTPLVKWPMLIAGNCRCFQPEGLRSIAEVVTTASPEPRAIYEDVLDLIRALGTQEADLVPFPAYEAVARELTRPSSFARALATGEANVERIDRLVLNLMHCTGRNSAAIEAIVSLVDAQLAQNRQMNPVSGIAQQP